jgi:hypothetical protein
VTTKPNRKKRRHVYRGGVPCPECGEHTRVTRTTVGDRRVKTRRKRSFILRERICVAGHHFKTEEHPQ